MHDEETADDRTQAPGPGTDRPAVDGPEGRKFYGAVTVGERGQIVIPARARRDHGITAGDKLIVLGSAEGLALMGVDALMDALSASTTLLDALRGDPNLHGDQP
ncbi:AbrB/MazE/SpoVT family DNA-binding domain-containing protein [Raineyella sp. LH-20]|uniref:AbrB/MazE/SpoVT family DNA-binding domain-containing protein n=1 Tax=Raineyella sp. LH-20 TaxID=3081204 RepID=UPI0029540716|nr:AbrB/MazE/SpoVT family DNA-binding domain-containing protein [Raineyella sp. LH-20]WOP19349.1 AbrB/MazE/SpoVT family DNA-binding domain-containing protein [Raineyella sp. LH-20]